MSPLVRLAPAILLALGSVSARGEHRVALLIGNDAYPRSELAASDFALEHMDRALRRHGFRTQVARNADRMELRRVVETFVRAVPTRGTALVYFHGYLLAGQNNGRTGRYLVPVDCPLDDQRQVGNQGYGLNDLLSQLAKRSGSRAQIVLLDAVLNRPGEEAGDDLFDAETMPGGTLVALNRLARASDSSSGRVKRPPGDSLARRLAETTGDLLEATRRSTDSVWESAKESPRMEPLATVSLAPPDAFPAGSSAGDEWVNSFGMIFCWCPPGGFRMGSPLEMPGRGSDEGPVDVTLTHGFWLAKYELTRLQFETLARRLPRQARARHKNEPIDSLHYDDRQQFLRPLNEQERQAGRLPNDWEYALPSEVEWEYAARAGVPEPFHFGEEMQDLPRYANFADKSLFETRDGHYSYAHRRLDDGAPYLARVGSYAPNRWGLHDMHGNLWEWCENRYVPRLIGGRDPFQVAEREADGQVARGGSWCSLPEYCRSAFRHHFGSREEQEFLGYRVILRRKRDGGGR